MIRELSFKNKTKTISLRIPENINAELDYYAGILGKTKSEIIREALIILVNILREARNEEDVKERLKKEIKEKIKHNIVFV